MQKIIIRLCIDIAIAFAVLNGWWFVAIPLSFVGIWLFPFFIEILVAGLVYDSLFGFVPEMGLWGYAGTLTSVLFFSVITLVKGSIR